MSDSQDTARDALARAAIIHAKTPKASPRFNVRNSISFIDTDLSKKLNVRYAQAIQISEIEEICRRMEAKQDTFVNYVSRRQIEQQDIPGDKTVLAAKLSVVPKVVRVTVVIRNTTKIVLALLLTSLATWTYSDFPIVNPFISLLGIVACPFFFWIANSLENQEAQN